MSSPSSHPVGYSSSSPGIDSIELFLNSKVRSREWMPTLPGCQPLSRTEILDDIDQITQSSIQDYHYTSRYL